MLVWNRKNQGTKLEDGALASLLTQIRKTFVQTRKKWRISTLVVPPPGLVTRQMHYTSLLSSMQYPLTLVQRSGQPLESKLHFEVIWY